jgi:predicted NBD/HSP70 family sugar kinase
VVYRAPRLFIASHTVGEKAFGAARGVDDLIYVRLSAGIGAGLILEGHPYPGVTGVAGEIRHVLSDPTGSVPPR